MGGKEVATKAYKLGWVLAVIAFVYKALMFIRGIEALAVRIEITPRHFLQAALLLFIISVAAVAQEFSGRAAGSAKGAA